MNDLESMLKQAIQTAAHKAFGTTPELSDIVIEIPKDKTHGDYATNIAMKQAKQWKKAPKEIAACLIEAMDKEQGQIETCEIAGPGFINFTMKKQAMANIIDYVIQQGDDYGHNQSGQHIKINVEYVSANPTGDLHLGHARGAAWGDSVSRLLKASGYDVCREYYVNDAGNQILNLAYSLKALYEQCFGLDAKLP